MVPCNSKFVMMESKSDELQIDEDESSEASAEKKRKTSDSNGPKSKSLEKGSEEYVKKRQRNNLAVKKSRERSKQRIQETQERVDQLTEENQELQTKVTLLSKELNVLRALFTNGGFTVPCNLHIVANQTSTASEVTSTTAPTTTMGDINEASASSIPKVTLGLEQLRHQAVPLNTVSVNSTSVPAMIPVSRSVSHPQVSSRSSPPPLEYVANQSSSSIDRDHRASVIRTSANPPGQPRKLIFITDKGQLLVKPEPQALQ